MLVFVRLSRVFSPPRGAVSASEGTIKFGSVCPSVRLSTFSCVYDSAASFCQIDIIFGIHVLLSDFSAGIVFGPDRSKA